MACILNLSGLILTGARYEFTRGASPGHNPCCVAHFDSIFLALTLGTSQFFISQLQNKNLSPAK